MHNPERGRLLDDVLDLLRHGLDREPIEAIPIRTGLIDTLLTGWNIRPQHDTLS
jgi:hypothetical protein